MAGGFRDSGVVILQITDGAGGKLRPASRTCRPGKFFFKEREKRFHPATDCFLLGDEARERPLQQAVTEIDFAGGQNISRRLIGY